MLIPEGEKPHDIGQLQAANQQPEPEDPPPPYTPTEDGYSSLDVDSSLSPSEGGSRSPSCFVCDHAHLGASPTTPGFWRPLSGTEQLYPGSVNAYATSSTAPEICVTPPGTSRNSLNSPSSSTGSDGSIQQTFATTSSLSPLHPNYMPSSYYEPSSSPASVSRSSSLNSKGDTEREDVSFGSAGHHWPAPKSWDRIPQPDLPYTEFPTLCLVSHTWSLINGFPELPPPCQLQPHPFANHDVTEEDWKQFLSEIKKAASLSKQQRIKYTVIPIVTPLLFLGRYYLAKKLEKSMLFENRVVAGDVVDHWNEMEVVLAQADERLSGREGRAPTVSADHARMANLLRRRPSKASCLSSSSDTTPGTSIRGDGDNLQEVHIDEEELRERKLQEKEARRKQKLEDKAKRKHGIEAPYQLFIQPL
ncbi:hypothetical protein BV22DRAFT_700826 [Leucogyrophana mollusca]|uniref:Uncharacterized protein n=1 Tax=Leucogyrophana mollusca TaxID=85980 RepID=A0ACB8B854_9AGAM|nr:hypothetical protein BV22DRAFT_700826 [Leucogyrophana mollusca]